MNSATPNLSGNRKSVTFNENTVEDVGTFSSSSDGPEEFKITDSNAKGDIKSMFKSAQAENTEVEELTVSITCVRKR